VSALFVTGTDTGVGKTLVTAAIAAALAEDGVRVAVAKPVETGCTSRDGRLFPQDAAALATAARSADPLEAICPYRFADPLAPALAAERAGRAIDREALVVGLRERIAAHEAVLIEGAGGLLVPITPIFTYADLAAALGVPVLLVVGSRLGAVNHALLSLEALDRRRLETRGYVLNRLVAGADLVVETNRDLLRSLTAARCLGELPWVDDAPALLAALAGSPPATPGTGVQSTAREADAARTRLASLARAHLDLTRLLAQVA
jgi:dethiobiotin synthetase